MVAGVWGRYSPSRKIDIISEVYVKGQSSAAELAERISEKLSITVTRNAIIGTYGRHAELAVKYPLTGARTGMNANSKPEEVAAKAQARLERQQEEAEERRLKKEKAEQAIIDKVAAGMIPDHKELSQPSYVYKRKMIEQWNAEHSQNITLVELTERTCKWPVNDGSPYLFCGCSKELKKSYCDFHCKQV